MVRQRQELLIRIDIGDTVIRKVLCSGLYHPSYELLHHQDLKFVNGIYALECILEIVWFF